MKSSIDRIITTHAGSLPRPPELLKLIRAKLAGEPYDEQELSAEIRRCVDELTKRQADIGLDVISDGEMSKPSFLSYINERLGGVTFTAEPFGNPWRGSRETNSFPEYYAWEASLNLSPASGAKRVVCNGPLSYKGHRQVAADIATLKAALAKVNVREAFLPAISPSNVEFWIRNQHYGSDEEYVFALADVLHEEYKAIADAGLLLQIDDPRLVTQYVLDANMSLEDCRKWAEVRVEALNRALRDIPEEQVRFHTCYSIDMGPRTNDMELKNIIDIILKIRAGDYSFEGANPRHEHEWKVWSHIDLPRHKNPDTRRHYPFDCVG
jgi:5-methyltetrahydropteroyltriglutamate--homocysteine methyltransferase